MFMLWGYQAQLHFLILDKEFSEWENDITLNNMVRLGQGDT